MQRSAGILIFLSFASVIFLSDCKQQPATLFKLLPSNKTGIDFNNVVKENDSINPLDLEFLYNGGGVAVGDFNRDGLPDLYFTASTVSNKLYLNKGHLHFQDITDEAGVGGEGRWCNSATVVDINNDGWPDIYVCATIKKNPEERKNLLYINQGLDKNGVPVFKEMAEEYGLADTGHSVVAAFFDYDHDGDLDLYLVETSPAGRNTSTFYGPMDQYGKRNSDKLFRNDWNDSLHHPVFTDVSKQAGIGDDGYGLSVDIADFNHDGWPDIYVDNDFLSSDLLYINNHDGTFTNRIKEYFRHTSQSAMGSDVEDINNDGLPDLISVDMNPEGNYRKKKNMMAENYNNFLNMLSYGYVVQYTRNTFQINQGPAVGENDSITHPVFSDMGYLSGVAETDWSWTPSIADFDNDGKKDIIITNGYPRDVTDHDFIAYRNMASNLAPKQMILDQIPSIKIPNYAFKNMGDLHFKNVTSQWGLTEPSFSSGGVFVDLDNDGDLDYVVNNINGKAFVYENMLNDGKKTGGNYLRIQFKGTAKNTAGIGAIAELHYAHGQLQVYHNTPTRGYLSSVDPIAHFGLGKIENIDTVLIKWPDGKEQLIKNVKANRLLVAEDRNATDPLNNEETNKSFREYSGDDTAAIRYEYPHPVLDTAAIFTNITGATGIHYINEEKDFVDFNFQKLLPHKLSQYGPAIAVGDIDGNGLDDILLGGAKGYAPQVLFQQPDKKFIQKDFTTLSDHYDLNRENRGILLFDANGDGRPDLYLTSGSVESPANSPDYQDQFYENTGHGHFKLDTAALPSNYTSKSCVKAADFDRDGDLDLFVGGRVEPGAYPKPVSSMILRNDSKPGKIKFTDVTGEVAPMLKHIGLVTDAVWTDFNNDGWPDLILVGEWMPVTFLENDHGHFKDVTAQSGIQNEIGWWNSIVAGDFENNGRMDYVVGNLGLNSFYRASHQYPMGIYAKDFDDNGSYDAIPTIYLPDSTGKMAEFPTEGRDDLIRQMIGIKRQFPSYKSFATATIRDILSPGQLKGALRLHANNFNSCYIENRGNGKFALHPLPIQAQAAPVYGMVADDFNGDGNLDLAITGNDYGTEVNTGRYDAMNGLVLQGNGRGQFIPLSILQSGLYIPGDGKALAKFIYGKDQYAIAASQNQGALKVFRDKHSPAVIRLRPMDAFARIRYRNGKTRKEEFSYGSSFLSQSGRFIGVGPGVESVEIVDYKGNRREIDFH